MEPEAPVWFAMSAPYRRELKAKELLDSKGIENYVAMHYVLKEKGGRKARVLEPVIHNLIFAHCTKSRIQEVKTGVDYLQYLTMVEDGRRVPMVVPDRQMEQFMKVCDTHNSRLRFFKPGEINLSQGARVRIIGGEFNGVEGVFIRLAGGRSRSVVVEIPMVASVATTTITPELIERLVD